MQEINEDLLNKWRQGNNVGRGWAIGEEGMTPEEAAKEYGLRSIHFLRVDGPVAGVDNEGNTVVVCDINGPWAVTLDQYTMMLIENLR